MRITIGWLCAALLICGGCGGDVRARVLIPNSADTLVGNSGFEAYKQAATDVEEKAAKYIARTAWTPDQRDYIVAASSGAIRRLSGIEGAVLGKTWDEPFGLREHTRGWRTIGRALAWRIDKAVKEGSYDDARFCLATALRMANALSTSDSHDAAMGLEIIDECIGALWPAIPRLEAKTLAGISSDLGRLLKQAPNTDAIVAQERTLMLAQLGWVHSEYQEREFSEISDTLGKAAEPAVKYLISLAEREADEQQTFFTGFGDEIEELVAVFSNRLRTAPYRWAADEKKGTRAWMRFTHAFATPSRVFVEQRAKVRTRLRLLAIDASLLAQFKSTGNIPRDLGAYPVELRSDPYSGENLVFISRGVDYKLYSVGPDGTDNGGDRGDMGLDR